MPYTGYLDVPAPGATVQRGALYFAGWMFRTETGQQCPGAAVTYPFGAIGLVTVYFEGLDGQGLSRVLSPPLLYGWLLRPDVQAAFGGTTSANTGYHVYLDPSDVPAPGRWRATLTWNTEIGSFAQTRDLTLLA